MRHVTQSLVLLFAIAAPPTSLTKAQTPSSFNLSRICGQLENLDFGPIDYRTATIEQKRLVEGAHFPPSVETLQRGHRGYLGGDIDYTLRAFPNHPRALSAMTRLAKQERTQQPLGARYHVECYFDRALRFRPDDPWPKVLYAFFLLEAKRHAEARSQLENIQLPVNDEDPQLLYNLGLAYFHLGELSVSMDYAKRAYSLGIQFPGLRRLLESRKAWID